MKHLILIFLLSVSLLANADSVNGSCLIGNSDYVEADFFYKLNNFQNRLSDGIITIANGSATPLVSLNIEISAEDNNGKIVKIYHEFKKFNPAIDGYMTFKIDGIKYESNNSISNIKISVSNPRCSSK